MRHTTWNASRKLFVSLSVLAVVLLIATIVQFTGKAARTNPYAGTPPAPNPSERAVFGHDSRPKPTDDKETVTRARTAPPAAVPPPDSNQPDTPKEAAPSEDGIQSFLARWRTTVARGDVEGQTQLYAPKLERFFRQRNVQQSDVRKVKSQMMTLYPTVYRYDISDVKVESNNGREAVVSFRKEWDMDGRKRFAGAERQRLKLRRVGGDWKIFSEEETKVYWVKRG